MPGKMALVNYHRCRPDQCDSGICKAVLECPLKLIKQEGPYEIPMTDPFACKGCGACVRACTARAIDMARM